MRPDHFPGPAPRVSSNDLVRVHVRDGEGDDSLLGTPEDALRDPRLTPGDRAAVRNILDAVDYLRTRFGYAGFDDAGRAVELVLHAGSGPSVQSGRIIVPATNPFAVLPEAHARPDVLLPADVARHELLHLVQARITGQPIGGRPPEQPGRGVDVITPMQARGVAEGIADAFAQLQVGTWKSGGDFRIQQPGKPPRVMRDFEEPSSPRALMSVSSVYDRASMADMTIDPHAQGGVVVAFARSLQQSVGTRRTEDVMWGILNDRDFAISKQAWREFAEAADRQSARAVTSDPELSRAIDEALTTVNLDELLA